MTDAQTLPEPLTPPGAHMRGNDWFPFKFQRLRRSKWWRRASDMARARNVMMWGEAYQATPAGSLPDDDDDLAEAAGYGMDVVAFLAVKDEIMAPWTMCSDGRWYHPTVCEVVLEVLNARNKAAAKKAAQRDKPKNVPDDDDFVPGTSGNVPGTSSDNNALSTGQGGDNPKNHRDISLQTDRQTKNPPTPLGGERDMFAKAIEIYPAVAKGGLDQDRAWIAWTAAAAEVDEAALLGCVEKMAASQYAKLNGGSRVQAFQRFLTSGRWRNWLTAQVGVMASTWSGPPEIREAMIAHVAEALRSRAKGEAFVASWVDPVTTWSDVPRAIVCRSGPVERKLRDTFASLLKDFGISVVLATDGKAA